MVAWRFGPPIANDSGVAGALGAQRQRQMDRNTQTDRQAETDGDRQREAETGRVRQTDRQTDRQTRNEECGSGAVEKGDGERLNRAAYPVSWPR